MLWLILELIIYCYFLLLVLLLWFLICLLILFWWFIVVLLVISHSVGCCLCLYFILMLLEIFIVQVATIFNRIQDEILNKLQKPTYRILILLTQQSTTIWQVLTYYISNLSHLLQYRPRPDHTIIIDNFINTFFINYKELFIILFTQLFLQMYIKPIINRPPKVSLINLTRIQAFKQYPTLFQIIHIELNKLSY